MLLKNLGLCRQHLGGFNSSNVPSSQTTQKISEAGAKKELKRINLHGLENRRDEITSGN